MPYIKISEREKLRQFLNPLLDHVANESYSCELTSGHLNYIITKIIKAFLECTDEYVPCYDDYNSVVGVLECVKDEFQRRKVHIYEDKKIIENSDVY